MISRPGARRAESASAATSNTRLRAAPMCANAGRQAFDSSMKVRAARPRGCGRRRTIAAVSSLQLLAKTMMSKKSARQRFAVDRALRDQCGERVSDGCGFVARGHANRDAATRRGRGQCCRETGPLIERAGRRCGSCSARAPSSRAQTCIGEKRGVHGVAVANVVFDRGQKMDQFERAAAGAAVAAKVGRPPANRHPTSNRRPPTSRSDRSARPAFVAEIRHQGEARTLGSMRAARAGGFERPLVDIDRQAGRSHWAASIDVRTPIEHPISNARSETPAAKCRRSSRDTSRSRTGSSRSSRDRTSAA